MQKTENAGLAQLIILLFTIPVLFSSLSCVITVCWLLPCDIEGTVDMEGGAILWPWPICVWATTLDCADGDLNSLSGITSDLLCTLFRLLSLAASSAVTKNSVTAVKAITTPSMICLGHHSVTSKVE